MCVKSQTIKNSSENLNEEKKKGHSKSSKELVVVVGGGLPMEMICGKYV